MECCFDYQRLQFTVIGLPFTWHCWPRVHGIKIIAPCGTLLELCPNGVQGHSWGLQRTTRASSGKAYMHNYMFDSKGATNIKS